MKSFKSALFIFTMLLMVSCGDDKKSKDNNASFSSNPYQATTVVGYYTHTRPQEFYADGRWYQMNPFSQQAMAQMQQLPYLASQALNSPQNPYPLILINSKVPAFRVKVTGSRGGYPQQQYQGGYPQQQPVSGNLIQVQSIQLY